MPWTVPTELVLIVDSDWIQTSVIHAVSGTVAYIRNP